MRIDRVQPAGAVPALTEQARLGQHLQVMTDGLLRRVEVRRDLARGQLAAPHQPKDLAAVRVGERPQYRVRGVTVIGLGDRRPTTPRHS